MFMKKFSFQSTVIGINEEEDEGDWNAVMAKCLGARHLAMLPQIPDITMSDAGDPSGIFSSMEDPEIGRDMGSICQNQPSPILPKTIIERVPNSPESSPYASRFPSPFPSPTPVSRSPSPSPQSRRSSRSTLKNSPLPQLSLPASPRSTRVSRASPRVSITSQHSQPASPQLSLPASLRSSRLSRASSRVSVALQSSPQPSLPASPRLSRGSRASPRVSIESQHSQPTSPLDIPVETPVETPAEPSVRPKRFFKGKRIEKWRGQYPIYKPLENGCYEVTGMIRPETPKIKKRKVRKIKARKVLQETQKTNINLSESFVDRSANTRAKNEKLIQSFENLQWKKSKGSDAIELASLFRDKTNGLASGFFRMHGLCEKPSQKTADYDTIYTLLKGSVAFKIGDDPFMIIKEFESVTIPERTGYGIKNLSEGESVLHFNVHA